MIFVLHTLLFSLLFVLLNIYFGKFVNFPRMVKQDLLTPEKLRIDGRKPHEIRPIICESGNVVPGADGSASVSMGLTKVIAYVYGPRPLNKRSQTVSTKASVIVDYRSATFGAIDRRRKSRGDRVSIERGMWLQKTFQEAILVDQFPRSQIEICVEILQQDGSAVSVAINAVTLALVNAGIPMRDLICSCTLGFIDNSTILVDLNQSESDGGSPQITLATYSRSGLISLCEVESKISVPSFQQGLKVGTASCSEVAQTIRTHIIDQAHVF